MKRQRGRGRKPGGNPGNRPLESNGPEVKIRGTAAQIYEKYMQYARDAQSAGDRVRFENLMQHAEHYFRIMAATTPRDRMPGQFENRNDDRDDMDSGAHDDNNGDNADEEVRGSDETVDASEEDASEEVHADGNDEAEGARHKSSRRRRPRRRNAEGDSSDSGGGGDTEAKSALDKLAHKQAAVAGG